MTIMENRELCKNFYKFPFSRYTEDVSPEDPPPFLLLFERNKEKRRDSSPAAE